MATQYLINFLLRGHTEAIEFEVRESSWLRAQSLFDNIESSDPSGRFLTFDAVEGLAVAISIADLQLVRFLWNAVRFPSDQKHKEDPVHVWLRGREDPIKLLPDEDKDSLSAFFIFLDSGADLTPFPDLMDIDGESTFFNAQEMVLVTAPLHEVREGDQLLLDGEPDNKGDSGDIPF